MANNKYTQEFKDEVVKLASVSGATQKQICKDFGVSKSALSKWLQDARHAAGEPVRGIPAGSMMVDAAEYRANLKRIKLLEQEAEVMRRAVAYLSAGVNPK